MNNVLREILFRDPLMKQAGLLYAWPLDAPSNCVQQSYSPPWAAVPSAHMQPVNGPTQGSALIAGPAGAASFTSASSQYLTQADASLLRSGSQSFWVSGWIYSTTNGIESIFAKGPQSAAAEFVLYRYNDSTLYWLVGNNSTFGQPSRPISLNTTTFYLGWYDATAGKVGLRLDHGTISLASYAGGSYASIYPLQIGAGNSTSRFNGRIGPVMYGIVQSGFRDWDKLSQTLYANGAGLDLVRRMPLATNFVGPVPGTRPLAWYKADGVNYQTAGGSPATADGDPVGYLTDFSGMGYSPTRTGTARPTLKTNIQNGLPVIRFDGVDDYLSYTLPGTFAGSPLHVFAVANTTSGANDDALMDISGNVKSISFQDPSGVPSLCGLSISAGDTTSLASGDFSGTVKVVISAKINNASSTIRINGTQVASGDAGGTRNGSVLYIGNDSSLARNFYGDIAEMIIYGGNLSSTDEQAVEAYLNAKWAVY